MIILTDFNNGTIYSIAHLNNSWIGYYVTNFSKSCSLSFAILQGNMKMAIRGFKFVWEREHTLGQW